MTIPAPRRRWFQFRLRTLFIALTLFGICFGGWAYLSRQAAIQRQAVATVREYGDLWYAHQKSDKGWGNVKAPPAAPPWLVSLMGEDYFVTPDLIYVRKSWPRSAHDEL